VAATIYSQPLFTTASKLWLQPDSSLRTSLRASIRAAVFRRQTHRHPEADGLQIYLAHQLARPVCRIPHCPCNRPTARLGMEYSVWMLWTVSSTSVTFIRNSIYRLAWLQYRTRRHHPYRFLRPAGSSTTRHNCCRRHRYRSLTLSTLFLHHQHDRCRHHENRSVLCGMKLLNLIVPDPIYSFINMILVFKLLLFLNC